MGEGAPEFKPCFEIFLRLAAKRYQTLLVPLADRHEPFVVYVQLGKLNVKRFRDAEPGAVHELEEGCVAERVLSVCGTFEYAVHFFTGEVFRQVAPEFRVCEHGFGAVVVLALVLHVLEEPAEAGVVPCDARGGVDGVVFVVALASVNDLPGGEGQEFVQYRRREVLQVQVALVQPAYKMAQVFLVTFNRLGGEVAFYTQV